jgi:hypothetical protein
VRVVGGGGLIILLVRLWLIYTYLQLKRRLKERQDFSTWNTILNHVYFKSPKLFLLTCHITGEVFIHKEWWLNKKEYQTFLHILWQHITSHNTSL